MVGIEPRVLLMLGKCSTDLHCQPLLIYTSRMQYLIQCLHTALFKFKLCFLELLEFFPDILRPGLVKSIDQKCLGRKAVSCPEHVQAFYLGIIP